MNVRFTVACQNVLLPSLNIFTAFCNKLSMIANGMITYDSDSPFDVGTVATYDCNPGYVLSVSGR